MFEGGATPPPPPSENVNFGDSFPSNWTLYVYGPASKQHIPF